MYLLYSFSSRPVALPFDFGWSHIDKLYHFVAYALLGGLGALFWRRLSGSLFWGILLGALFASLFGISDEWHQWFVPGRSSSFGDLVADICGALAGAWAIAWRKPTEGEKKRDVPAGGN